MKDNTIFKAFDTAAKFGSTQAEKAPEVNPQVKIGLNQARGAEDQARLEPPPEKTPARPPVWPIAN